MLSDILARAPSGGGGRYSEMNADLVMLIQKARTATDSKRKSAAAAHKVYTLCMIHCIARFGCPGTHSVVCCVRSMAAEGPTQSFAMAAQGPTQSFVV